ncbi:hypothetical protein [Floridanema aerugineum]|uniref:Uncharacterized protein n=1 Tax=Floridaenema aerugineum BLCC-F46 TaxID=3153654 RepID=A0ABV4XHQ4_9CYAN
MLKKVKTKQTLNKDLESIPFSQMQGDAIPPLVRLIITPGEAGNNGGHSEPDRESLLAEIGMSKFI